MAGMLRTLLKSSAARHCGGRPVRAFPALRRFVSTADISSAKYSASCFPSTVGLRDLDTFPRRHLGPRPEDVSEMLKVVEAPDIETFVSNALPPKVLVKRALNIDPPQGLSESAMLRKLKEIASKNKVLRSYIGKGYYGTHMPAVIQRNIMENPAWYTSYTPYQAEVSQGRLEALLTFQTVIVDLTGLPVANASLLDEGTAAAEAMIMSFHHTRGKKRTFIVDKNTHEQTIAVIKSRANTLGLNLVVADLLSPEGISTLKASAKDLCGALVSYPGDNGEIPRITALQQIADTVHDSKGLFAVDADLLSLTLMHPPSTFGADIALGSAQRFGVPMGFGGPHAAFFAVREELKRKMPGRLVGISTDRLGKPALRLALQTREQHIRREKATSNICTAQALLANVAAAYAVYHGPEGLRDIARRVHGLAALLARAVEKNSSHKLLGDGIYFDTLRIQLSGESADQLMNRAVNTYGINLFKVNDSTVQLSLDETVTEKDLADLAELFTGNREIPDGVTDFPEFPPEWQRKDSILTNSVFHEHHSETAMLRFLYSLQQKDIALTTSMISLGSCTMKLNGTVEMLPITWPEFADLHPFVPRDQAQGYLQLIDELEHDLQQITGFAKTTLMPNSGAQGEYTGLSVIRQYHHHRGEPQRNVVLIPVSAHGTNPASAAMAGFKVVPVKCLENGSLDMADMEKQAKKNKDNLAAFMITYPTTYGLFEPGIRDAIDLTHKYGGQVYMDGANMNAQVGLTSPADLGADVCHLNLHKTFCIPHGGGGPGVGPICVAEHLKGFLPKHPLAETSNHDTTNAIDPVSSGPFGSASVLPISYAYIKLMGGENIPFSSVTAILNANYMLYRLKDAYKIQFIGSDDFKYCGHEFILDLRPFKKYHIEAIDVAKRLQDYGFHAPTMAFPIPDTLMVEPTESENLDELNRFVDSLLSIREEIRAVEEGKSEGLVLKNSPHPIEDLLQDDTVWSKRGYTREQAAYPLPYLKNFKTWPTVSRVDDVYGDTHLLCTCPPVSAYAE
ncbi:DEKNAAC101112 [Brettanomyces naardenensis]|uniref:Glycine cleavage system P protein n=1 Tax=Brettanomyces naardenensis TaxID=13370 RepID=A0A448YHA9_BRENA|nr:DEKNAAC101112 [Brettanomyces naardenensis]